MSQEKNQDVETEHEHEAEPAPHPGGAKKLIYTVAVLLAVVAGIYIAVSIFTPTKTKPVPGVKESAQSKPENQPQQTAAAPEVKEAAQPKGKEEQKPAAEAPPTPKPEAESRKEAVLPEKAKPEIEGVAFTRALIKVLDDQLNENTFGWRPNSFLFGKIHLTDNVNNMQLGVLETVRITSVVLKEKISRYGDADAFDPRIENAVNLFMNSAFQFWFPSADDQFNQGLNELRSYLKDLEAGKSKFYPRSDNFDALIETCKELVGNCHHNLVKKKENDGTPVSMFTVDDYFYYAQGVALAMSQILETALYDFKEELQIIKGTKLLAEVVENLKEASQLKPLIVFNGDLDGFLANHRANMAVPMGEALFKMANLLRY